MPRIKEYKHPMTTDGRYLDYFCNTIDSTLNYEILDHIREADLSKVPSTVQREGFELMRELLEFASSLAGTLRYDLSADHTDCPEHDEHMARKIVRINARLADKARK